MSSVFPSRKSTTIIADLFESNDCNLYSREYGIKFRFTFGCLLQGRKSDTKVKFKSKKGRNKLKITKSSACNVPLADLKLTGLKGAWNFFSP